MSTIIIPLDSESDSDFKNDLAEAERRSILEARLNVGERSDAGKVVLALYFLMFDKYDSGIVCHV